MLSPLCIDCPLQGSVTFCHPGIVCKVDIDVPESDEMGYDPVTMGPRPDPDACQHEHTFQQEEGVTCTDCGAVFSDDEECRQECFIDANTNVI